jgi:hypothetical protein
MTNKKASSLWFNNKSEEETFFYANEKVRYCKIVGCLEI